MSTSKSSWCGEGEGGGGGEGEGGGRGGGGCIPPSPSPPPSPGWRWEGEEEEGGEEKGEKVSLLTHATMLVGVGKNSVLLLLL